MGKELQGRVDEFIRRQGMCAPRDRILVACSGGPDSIALLDILRSLGFSVGVVHVDHGQHRDSGRIAAQVRKRCLRWKITFHPAKLDAPPGSSEELLRTERYRVFETLCADNGYRRVATGHTQTDQVETVLMRILRGTGVAGLAGIPAVRGIYIRPLLECTREEILDYLKSRRLAWKADPTNRDHGFLRNRIRLQILPLLRRQVNPSVDRALLRLSQAAARDDDFIGCTLGDTRPDLSRPQVAALPLESFDRLHDSQATRVVLDMLRRISPPGANLEKLHTDRILSMIRRSGERGSWRLDLPEGLTAGREGRSFYVRHGTSRPAPGFQLVMEEPGDLILPDGESSLRFRLDSSWDRSNPSSRKVYFDAGRVGFPLQIRSVEPGDRLRVWGGGGSRKVSRILLDAKVPKTLRPQVPLLVKDGRILWVAGLRRSDTAPVKKSTRRVLSVEWFPAQPLG